MTSKDRPSGFKGPLTPQQVANGMNAATRNARRLAADARILLDAGRHPSAAALAALSIEESGKVSILRAIAVLTDPVRLQKEWRRFRDHQSKNGMWILPALAAEGARRLSELSKTIEREAEHTALLNSLKQISLYTDCYGNAHWSEPAQVVNEDLATSLVSIAELLAKDREYSAREIELWVQHLGPAWGTPEMPFALLRWVAAVHAEGLNDTTVEEMARFVFGHDEAALVVNQLNRDVPPKRRH